MNEQDKKAINSIFPQPVAARLVEIVTANKPTGWSKRSNATYFKQCYAEATKEDIDKMIATGQSLRYRYATWCADGTISKNTLYLRVNQSIRYLIEKMDHNSYYAQWYEKVKVDRLKEGIVISFISGMGTNKLHADLIENEEQGPQWRRVLRKWLEDEEDTQPFIRENLMLTPEEIKVLREELAQLTHIMCSITANSIRIIKSK